MSNATTMHRLERLVEDLVSVRCPGGSSGYGRAPRRVPATKINVKDRIRFILAICPSTGMMQRRLMLSQQR